jgi:glycosyltransferase involved in cell wall biosynthesis
MELSICIPTYNRGKHINNCLNSILINQLNNDFEIIISDNGSTDNTEYVVSEYIDKLPIKYFKNIENIGIPRNFINAVSKANGKFIWLLGDDDLLLKDSIESILLLINSHNDVDFFFVNTFHCDTDYIFQYEQPFDTKLLPNDLEKFSKYNINKTVNFLDLINPDISFDFLGGMFLAVFRKTNWDKNIFNLNIENIKDLNTFSNYDNTFPHVKIFANAFKDSKAYINTTPLSVALTGAREWAPMYNFVRSVRLIESLEIYRKCGLKLSSYIKCKNYALRSFIPDIGYILFNPKVSGLKYLKIIHIVKNIYYPNFYLSLLYYILRKIKLYEK